MMALTLDTPSREDRLIAIGAIPALRSIAARRDKLLDCHTRHVTRPHADGLEIQDWVYALRDAGWATVDNLAQPWRIGLTEEGRRMAE